IIEHDSTFEIEANESCEAIGCYNRGITYTAPLQQLVALAKKSKRCRQYLKARCQGVRLSTYAWWVSAQQVKKYYWGGSTSTANKYCACGNTGTCVKTRVKCNCDVNSNSRIDVDEGYIIEKEALPITALQFGDMDHVNERLWHTVGPLECY
uniref:Uncharacterized protein n=1 Tax=Ciona savignyi TaxID=51511 RepID=H2YZI7_CIOSA